MTAKGVKHPSDSPPVRSQATIRVDLVGRGMWEVAVPGRTGRLRCATLDEAERVASRYASRRRPCELIVRDAYHRVVHRELVNGRT